jgi:hypothetical protein
MPGVDFKEMPTGDSIEVKEFDKGKGGKGELVDLDQFREEASAVKARVDRKVDDSAAERADREKSQQDIQRARIARAAERQEEPIESVVHHKQWLEEFPNSENPAGNTLSRRQLEKADGPFTKFMNWLYKRGEKK